MPLLVRTCIAGDVHNSSSAPAHQRQERFAHADWPPEVHLHDLFHVLHGHDLGVSGHADPSIVHNAP